MTLVLVSLSCCVCFSSEKLMPVFSKSTSVEWNNKMYWIISLSFRFRSLLLWGQSRNYDINDKYEEAIFPKYAMSIRIVEASNDLSENPALPPPQDHNFLSSARLVQRIKSFGTESVGVSLSADESNVWSIFFLLKLAETFHRNISAIFVLF